MLTLYLLFLYLKKKFVYLWLSWVFLAACGLSLVVASRGFSLHWLLSLQSAGSRCAGFRSDPSACGVFLDQGSKEPVSPALAGRFLNHWTTREAFLYFLCYFLPLP